MQSGGAPSIEVLKTATLLASPFVELVLRESPAGEHATNGVAESAMDKVKTADTNAEIYSGSACGKDR